MIVPRKFVYGVVVGHNGCCVVGVLIHAPGGAVRSVCLALSHTLCVRSLISVPMTAEPSSDIQIYSPFGALASECVSASVSLASPGNWLANVRLSCETIPSPSRHPPLKKASVPFPRPYYLSKRTTCFSPSISNRSHDYSRSLSQFHSRRNCNRDSPASSHPASPCRARQYGAYWVHPKEGQRAQTQDQYHRGWGSCRRSLHEADSPRRDRGILSGPLPFRLWGEVNVSPLFCNKKQKSKERLREYVRNFLCANRF